MSPISLSPSRLTAGKLTHIAELLEKGEVKPIMDNVWKFEEFKEAFVNVESEQPRGKAIIKVQE
jgi:NADPH:quinone reductase-like Zn-dependent oxidoreductase